MIRPFTVFCKLNQMSFSDRQWLEKEAGSLSHTDGACPVCHAKACMSPFASYTRYLVEWEDGLPARYPEGDRVRLVLDNLKVYKARKVQEYLGTVPGRFEFVFTPTHGSWPNLVEGFFSKLTRQMLRGIRVKSKQELESQGY